ncbi:hypothetical protein CDAR_113381 [Caerostris darwini]|uniref:Transmembrane protein n=1 Tax=Caerostris darwini TaxID=1538125 RepID=A0AAV4RBT8_9ARAC|nr:hypothetical protein CDAR_113381 [Caerostris darwini]
MVNRSPDMALSPFYGNPARDFAPSQNRLLFPRSGRRSLSEFLCSPRTWCSLFFYFYFLFLFFEEGYSFAFSRTGHHRVSVVLCPLGFTGSKFSSKAEGVGGRIFLVLA